MKKLDLGAGPLSPEGYEPLGRAHGTEIFPLPAADASVDAIRASHCLEHFPHAQVPAVLADWARALKPGGEMQIAVPDFDKIADAYVAGAAMPTEGYVMGGQTDENDFHKSLFTGPHLTGLLNQAGLVLVRPWKSDIADCAALPVSLNLAARKPHRTRAKIRAVMSTPRLGFNDMWESALLSLPPLGIELSRVTGAFWDQCLTMAFGDALKDPELDYVLSLDYDSVFNAGHVAALLHTAFVYPQADALAAVQASRHRDAPLFGLHGMADGTHDVDRAILERDLVRVRHAHFGLTLIDARKLRALPMPWLTGEPAPDGTWGPGKTDPDIAFWRKWEEAGHSLHVASRVVIGHMELMVRWPDENLRAIYQPANEWDKSRAAPGKTWTGFET